MASQNILKSDEYKDMANAIRALAMDAVQQANSGHPGMPMGMADVATCLFANHLKFSSASPDWADRDRFILSAGHGSMLLYALLYLTGYEDMTLEEIKNFRQLGSRTAGHPEYGHAKGIETTTGPLGQGIANAVGFAMGEAMLRNRFGHDLVDHYCYVIAGDGCLMEGISHEAASLAGHLKLSRLIVLYDDNHISIDGDTDLSLSDDAMMRFQSYGWDVSQIDGHNPNEINDAITLAQKTDRPSLICRRTIIGYGAPTKAGKASAHGAPLGGDEIEGARQALGWDHPPFHIPEKLLKKWQAVGVRGESKRLSWLERVKVSRLGDEFSRMIEGRLPHGFIEKSNEILANMELKKEATRVASQNALEALIPLLPDLIGGSADLTGSNNTKTKEMVAINADDFSGRYIHYGVREHAMAAAMNGMVLHGGFIPYGGTFMCFTDYCRPSIRLAALMGIQSIFVMTHDSIGLGEDGPTHQPVEHMAALRAIPNLLVMRPADARETLEAWLIAIESKFTPTILSLTRQGLLPIREYDKGHAVNRVKLGGYIVGDETQAKARHITLMASGSEVELAMAAQSELAKEGIKATVISIPCFELLRQQGKDYIHNLLGNAPRIAIEAGIRQGWDEWLGHDGIFIGMDGFGASAPASELYRHFGITTEAIIKATKSLI